LQDKKGFRVVDKKHPDQQGQQAKRRQVDIERAGQVCGRGKPRVYAVDLRGTRQLRRDLATPARGVGGRGRLPSTTARSAWSRASSHFSLDSLSTCCSFWRSCQ
jgi:hypothetical protein